MYSKEEAARLRQEFWIRFGQYMKPVPSASGLPVNWINYKTGVKHIHFKMDVNKKEAVIAIQLSHPDAGVRDLIFNQFEEFKRMFRDVLNEDWVWQQHATDDYGKELSLIYTNLPGVNIYNKEYWPELISFFKPRILALDDFWDSVKPVFVSLS